MRGIQLKTTLLLILLTCLAGTVFCTEDDTVDTTEAPPEEQVDDHSDATAPSQNPLDENEQADPGAEGSETTQVPEETENLTSIQGVEGEDLGSGNYDGDSRMLTTSPPDTEEQSSDTIIFIVAAIAAVIFTIIVVGIIFFCRRHKKALNQEMCKEDPYLDGSSTEKVPMPMFEDDVPSVQELEMEELDEWMNKDS